MWAEVICQRCLPPPPAESERPLWSETCKTIRLKPGMHTLRKPFLLFIIVRLSFRCCCDEFELVKIPRELKHSPPAANSSFIRHVISWSSHSLNFSHARHNDAHRCLMRANEYSDEGNWRLSLMRKLKPDKTLHVAMDARAFPAPTGLASVQAGTADCCTNSLVPLAIVIKLRICYSHAANYFKMKFSFRLNLLSHAGLCGR